METTINEAYNSTKKYKCPYCSYSGYRDNLVDHIEKEHEDMIPENYNANRVVFNLLNKKDHGVCVVCKKETPWNLNANKYDRVCNNPRCTKKLADTAQKNMIKVHNMTSGEMLKKEERQTKMLARRSISGKYKFKDGGVRTYTGSYEKKALEFFDTILGVPSKDIITPGPILKYKHNGKTLKWITDIYYIPFNLVIEVKDGGANPNKRQMPSYRQKQLDKEEMITNLGTYNYLRLTDNNFGQLLQVMAELKMQMINDVDENKIIRINEGAMVGIHDTLRTNKAFIVNYSRNNTFVEDDDYEGMGLCNDLITDNIFIIDKDGKPCLKEYKAFLQNRSITVYEYIGDNSSLEQALDSIKESDRVYNDRHFYDILSNTQSLTIDEIAYNENFKLVDVERLSFFNDIQLESIRHQYSELTNPNISLPLISPKKQYIANAILNESSNLSIKEDINGYFIYNKITNERTSSFKEMEDLVSKDKLADEWEKESMNKIIHDVDSESKLDREKLDYDMQSIDKRKESDEMSVDIYGKTNEERYKDLKSKYLKKDIKDNSYIYRASGSIKEEFKDDYIDFAHIKYTNDDIRLAKQWLDGSMYKMVIPADTQQELEDYWLAFNSMTLKQRLRSDEKSVEYFGIDNKTHYEYLKSKFLKNDIDTEDIPDVYVPTTSNASVIEQLIEKKTSNIDTLSESCLTDIMLENSIDFIESSSCDYNKDVLHNDLPFFSPFEMEHLSCNENTNSLYSDKPDNLYLNNVITVKEWYKNYKLLFNGHCTEIIKENTSDWINTLNRLYLDFDIIKESGDIDLINSRKQSILNLGWNPNIPFTIKNRLQASSRIKYLSSSIYSNITDLREYVSYMQPEESINEYSFEESVLHPIYIVMVEGTSIFSAAIKTFTKSIYSHAGISFNPKLDKIYSFNIDFNKNGFSIENVNKYNKNSRLAVFTIFVKDKEYNIMKKNVEMFNTLKDKTKYSILNILAIPFNVSVEMDLNKVCSQFVDNILKLADIDLTDKTSSLVTPNDIYNMKTKKKNIYVVFEDLVKNYKYRKVVASFKKLAITPIKENTIDYSLKETSSELVKIDNVFKYKAFE